MRILLVIFSILIISCNPASKGSIQQTYYATYNRAEINYLQKGDTVYIQKLDTITAYSDSEAVVKTYGYILSYNHAYTQINEAVKRPVNALITGYKITDQNYKPVTFVLSEDAKSIIKTNLEETFTHTDSMTEAIKKADTFTKL